MRRTPRHHVLPLSGPSAARQLADDAKCTELRGQGGPGRAVRVSEALEADEAPDLACLAKLGRISKPAAQWTSDHRTERRSPMSA